MSVEEKNVFPGGYEGISSAPENEELSVMWKAGKRSSYGRAVKFGNSWFIKSDPNFFGNGRQCAAPVAWHPKEECESE
ncbi:hypothetical protein ACFL3M_03410 [Patescibacteria group bacterium]